MGWRDAPTVAPAPAPKAQAAPSWAQAPLAGAGKLGKQLEGLSPEDAAAMGVGPPVPQNKELVDKMGGWDRLITGIGAGMYHVGQNVIDLLADFDPRLEQLKSKPTERAEERKLTRTLTEGTNAGYLGNMAGEIAPTLPFSMGAGAAGKAVASKVLPEAAQFLVPAATGAAEGGTQGYLISDPEHRVASTLGGALLGGAIPLAAQGARRLYSSVEPSAAAKYLTEQGVEGMTLGQVAPDSWLGMLEEANSESKAGGNVLKRLRAEPARSLENVLVNKVTAPGSAAIPRGQLNDQVAAAYRSFGPAYEALNNAPIKAFYDGVPLRQHLADAFNGITADPGVYLDKAAREDINAFLQNQATILDKVPFLPDAQQVATSGAKGLPASTARGLPAGSALARPMSPAGAAFADRTETIPARALLTIRENVRKEIRDLMSGTPSPSDFKRVRMFENAENAISSAIENQLGPEHAATLRGIDAQYARYKTIEDAVARTGDQISGLTPAKLSAAIKSNTEKGAYARGGGGELRQLARAAHEVFDPRQPHNGALLLGHAIPSFITAPLNIAANYSPVKRFLLGEYAPQVGLQTFEDWARQKGLIEALRRGTTVLGTEAEAQR